VRAAGPDGDALLGFLKEEHGLRLDKRITRRKVLSAVNRYDGQIFSTDRALESFFSTVNAEGLADDALWVIASDHGEGLGNHEHMGHGKTIYNEQTRVPLLFYFSDQRYPPQRVDGLFGLVDVAPTLAEVAGTSFAAAELAVPLAGRSFLGVLQGETWEERPIYTQRRPADELRLSQGWTPGEVFALQTDTLKVIAKTNGEHEVYDLTADPLELQDLINDAPPPGKERMLRELVRLYRRMTEESAALDTGGINPEFIDELKALGYL
jgi:arylsulfatase A-like enzyme